MTNHLRKHGHVITVCVGRGGQDRDKSSILIHQRGLFQCMMLAQGPTFSKGEMRLGHTWWMAGLNLGLIWHDSWTGPLGWVGMHLGSYSFKHADVGLLFVKCLARSNILIQGAYRVLKRARLRPKFQVSRLNLRHYCRPITKENGLGQELVWPRECHRFLPILHSGDIIGPLD